MSERKRDEKEEKKEEKDEKSREEKWRRDPLSAAIWAGILIWAGLVCSLALLSSWLPARQAGRLSIRETLIYLG